MENDMRIIIITTAIIIRPGRGADVPVLGRADGAGGRRQRRALRVGPAARPRGAAHPRGARRGGRRRHGAGRLAARQGGGLGRRRQEGRRVDHEVRLGTAVAIARNFFKKNSFFSRELDRLGGADDD